MMKQPTDQLLDDLLSDAAPAEFRADLLEHTLRQVRRRRHQRHWGSALLTIVCVVAVSLTLWNMRSPQFPTVTVSRPPSLVIVRSRPLDPKMIVETRPGTVATVASSTTTYAPVETGTAKRLFREIDDEQLLALLAGKPAALVRRGPNQVELIFLNPEDEKGFPIQ